MIADRLCLMRLGKQLKEDDRLRLATEASYLYAPLAHRLGLYKIKSELEDLSLKYTDPKQYDFIKKKLNETKRSRDIYIAEFIAPIKKKLQEAGLQFDIKGRTKSIHSINNKLKSRRSSLKAYTTCSRSVSCWILHLKKNVRNAGRYIRSLPTCTSLTPTV